MIKKIISFIISLFILGLWISGVSAADNDKFEVINNKGTLEVSKDSILVWTAIKNTSVIDLFKNLNIDGKDINNEDILNYLDVRYITKENGKDVDYKVNSDTDIIDKDAKIYVLFKDKENGGLVDSNSTVQFELKNLKLKEIWLVSDLQDNSYDKIYDVIYKTEEVKTTNNETTEEPVINEEVLTENNTWIKDNILIITLALITLIGLFWFPKLNNLKD